MSFSAAMGLAGSAIGAIAGLGAAKAQAEAAMYAAQQQRLTEESMMELSRQNMGIGLDILRRETAQQQYAYDRNAENQALALDQRNYGRNLVAMDRERAIQERNFQIERIRELDYASQVEFERRLASMQNNASITKSERERAIQEMQRAQQIAAQERQAQIAWLEEDRARAERERTEALDYLNYNRDLARDERRFDIGQLERGQSIASSERAQALGFLEDSRQRAAAERETDLFNFNRAAEQRRSERGFQESEYRALRAQAMAERAFDIERRNQVDQATARYGDALSAALESMGPARQVAYLGEDAIAQEVARRERVAVDDINQMADRVASINEANLIRSGVDQSTRATAERADITDRMAQEMARAREAARSEAIRYIAGVNDQLRLGEDQDRSRRAQTLQETANVYGVPVEMLMRAPQVSSALSGPSIGEVGSAVYDRGIQSANNFDSPLAVNTANYNMGVGSAANYSGPLNVGSTLLNRSFSSANDYRNPLDVGSAAYSFLDQDMGTGTSGVFQYQSGIGSQPFNNSGEFNFQLPQMTSAGALFSGANAGMASILQNQGVNARYADQNAQIAGMVGGRQFTDFTKNLGAFLDDSGIFDPKPLRPQPAMSTPIYSKTRPYTSFDYDLSFPLSPLSSNRVNLPTFDTRLRF